MRCGPFLALCGDRYTKKWIDFNGWDYQGRWGDCNGSGGVALGTVTGRLLTDTDHDGTSSAGDTPVVDQDLVVKNSGGTVVGTGYTTDTGEFSLRTTPGSNLHLELVPMPDDRYPGYNWPGGFTVPNGTISLGTVGLNIVSFGSVTGTAFHDQNDDGVHDSGEPALAGMRVTVTKYNQPFGPSRMVTTDSDGRWTMGGLDRRFSYVAHYVGPAGFSVHDDPFQIDEERDYFSPSAGSPVNESDVALVDNHIPPPGPVLEGEVMGGYNGWEVVAGAIVRMDDGHIARTDQSGQFRMEAMTLGTHHYFVETDDDHYATGSIEITAGRNFTSIINDGP